MATPNLTNPHQHVKLRMAFQNAAVNAIDAIDSKHSTLHSTQLGWQQLWPVLLASQQATHLAFVFLQDAF